MGYDEQMKVDREVGPQSLQCELLREHRPDTNASFESSRSVPPRTRPRPTYTPKQTHPSIASPKMSTPSTSSPSSSSSSSVPPEQFKAIVRQEEDRLRKMHPTPEDIPGCMTVFDDFLKCNRALTLSSPLFPPCLTHCTQHLRMTWNVPSPRQPIPLPLALRPIRKLHHQTPRLQVLHVDSAVRAG